MITDSALLKSLTPACLEEICIARAQQLLPADADPAAVLLRAKLICLFIHDLLGFPSLDLH